MECERIVICGPISTEARGILETAGYRVDVYSDLSAEAEAAAQRAVALVVRSHSPVTAELMARCPDLRIIGRPGSGTEKVDAAAARQRGIAVVSTPGVNAVTVAEHTMGLLLALSRRLVPLSAGLRAGRWEKAEYGGVELAGRTLALVGLGRIGSAVALRARPFGLRVVAHDPYVEAERAAELGVELRELDEALGGADAVSLHTPLTPETAGLLDARRLALLRPGALVVNTARGALLDSAALLAALETGQVGGAALDVFTAEPPGDDPLLRHPHVIATPHVGGMSPETLERASRIMAGRLVEVLGTGRGVPGETGTGA